MATTAKFGSSIIRPDLSTLKKLNHTLFKCNQAATIQTLLSQALKANGGKFGKWMVLLLPT